jgi:hypothetical protein
MTYVTPDETRCPLQHIQVLPLMLLEVFARPSTSVTRRVAIHGWGGVVAELVLPGTIIGAIHRTYLL